MDSIVIKSPAKINIGLNILNKRDDGFHNIETIFYPIDLFDVITLKKSDKFSFTSNDDKLNQEKTNLIIKAKEILENYLDRKLDVNISLKKQIPIGAGLGGGSANAASMMLALNELFDLKIKSSTLSELAIKLGSDVPFFINPVPSFAESRGELLYPIKIKIKKVLLIVNPGIHIATKWAFSLIRPDYPPKSLRSFIQRDDFTIDDIMKIASNDFEQIVFNHFPEIKEIKDKMLDFGADYSMMTGTGSTVWGMFESEEAAYQTEFFFKCKNYFTFIQNSI